MTSQTLYVHSWTCSFSSFAPQVHTDDRVVHGDMILAEQVVGALTRQQAIYGRALTS